MIIRPVKTSDIDALSTLACDCFTQTFGHLYPPEDLAFFLENSYAPEIFAKEVADPTYFWRVVEDEGQLVAYLTCASVSLPHTDANPVTDGELKRLYIREGFQGRGLGRTLGQIALDYLSNTYGGAAQWVGVWSENQKAQGLYQALGFEKVGDYGFAVGNTLDAEWIMRRWP